MLPRHFAGMSAVLIAGVLAAPAQAQQPAAPPFATTKVADNVYIFPYLIGALVIFRISSI